MTTPAPEVLLTMPARPEGVGVVRQALAGMADALDFDPTVLADMKMAVTEACTNVVVHAYDEDAGMLEVEMLADESTLTIVVRDWGTGIQPRPHRREAPALGLGLPLIAYGLIFNLGLAVVAEERVEGRQAHRGTADVHGRPVAGLRRQGGRVEELGGGLELADQPTVGRSLSHASGIVFPVLLGGGDHGGAVGADEPSPVGSGPVEAKFGGGVAGHLVGGGRATGRHGAETQPDVGCGAGARRGGQQLGQSGAQGAGRVGPQAQQRGALVVGHGGGARRRLIVVQDGVGVVDDPQTE